MHRLGTDLDALAIEHKDVCKGDVEDDGVILIFVHHFADGAHALRDHLGVELVAALLDEGKPWCVDRVIAVIPAVEDVKAVRGNAKNVVKANELR